MAELPDDSNPQKAEPVLPPIPAFDDSVINGLRETRKKQRSTRMVLAIVGVVVLLIPVPTTKRTSCPAEPVSLGDVRSPAGTLGELKVKAGARVTEGQVLGSVDRAKELAQLAALKAQAMGGAPKPAPAAPPPSPVALKKAQAAVTKAEKEAAKANALVAKVQKSAKPGAPALKKAQADATKKQAALTAARAALEALTPPKPVVEKTQDPQKAMAELQALIDSGTIKSPGKGVLELKADQKPGAVFTEATVIGRVLSEEAARVKASCAAAEEGARIVASGKRYPVSELQTRDGALEVAIAAPKKKAGETELPAPSLVSELSVETPGGWRPWPMALLRK